MFRLRKKSGGRKIEERLRGCVRAQGVWDVRDRASCKKTERGVRAIGSNPSFLGLVECGPGCLIPGGRLPAGDLLQARDVEDVRVVVGVLVGELVAQDLLVPDFSLEVFADEDVVVAVV